MKELNHVFLERSGLQLLRILTLFAFWRFFNVRTPERYVPANLLSTKCYILILGEIRVEEKTDPKKLPKKFNYLLLCLIVFNRSMNLKLFSAFCENLKIYPVFCKTFRKKLCILVTSEIG